MNHAGNATASPSAKRTPSKGSILVQNKLPLYVKFLGQELINPTTILTACLIGAAINATQSKDIFFSAVPYVIPLLVQGFAKASLKFKIKEIDFLCQLPAQRKDPAFVSDREGRIISAQGITKKLFHDNKIQNLHHLFGNAEVKIILQAAANAMEKPAAEPLELYSEIDGKWYQVQTKIGAGDHILIWLDDISSRKAMEFSLSALGHSTSSHKV